MLRYFIEATRDHRMGIKAKKGEFALFFLCLHGFFDFIFEF